MDLRHQFSRLGTDNLFKGLRRGHCPQRLSLDILVQCGAVHRAAGEPLFLWPWPQTQVLCWRSLCCDEFWGLSTGDVSSRREHSVSDPRRLLHGGSSVGGQDGESAWSG